MDAGFSLTARFDRVILTAWREVMAADMESVVLSTETQDRQRPAPAPVTNRCTGR